MKHFQPRYEMMSFWIRMEALEWMDKGTMFSTFRTSYSSKIAIKHTLMCLKSCKAQPFYSVGKDTFTLKWLTRIYCACHLPLPLGLPLLLGDWVMCTCWQCHRQAFIKLCLFSNGTAGMMIVYCTISWSYVRL